MGASEMERENARNYTTIDARVSSVVLVDRLFPRDKVRSINVHWLSHFAAIDKIEETSRDLAYLYISG